MSTRQTIDRRRFLQLGLAGGAWAATPAGHRQRPAGPPAVTLVSDPADPVAAAPAVQWALGELRDALAAAGVTVRQVDRLERAAATDLCIVTAGHTSQIAAAALARARVTLAAGPEALSLLRARISGRDVLLACGTDARGVMYAVTELADRLRSGADPGAALTVTAPIVERPANAVRSVMRQFTSDVLDTGWFNDREMWPRYLSMLATHRFNRLHLGFGLGYDMLQAVTDSYLLFLYPFVVDVPGFGVRVSNLSDAERDRNLDTLRFISEQTVARGLEFQLGVWMHGYQLNNSPQARHVVEGLTPERHAAYCRDGLTAILRACPAISAVALRIHGESGIAEGSYDFWRTVFDGVPRAGRAVEIDLHAKGLDQKMIDAALATGMPVNVSPKYWAEHLGMPYHQAAIRDLEMPVAGRTGAGLMTMSEGARSFTRYGYADFLRDDRRYTVRHRVFAGTQRLLLSGDPAATSAYARMFPFCGSTGMDLMEPLTCRGRRGTGIAGSRRSGYIDDQLETRWDWEKYAYWYRVWGRLTYNPDAVPDQWQRQFRGDARAAVLEDGLAKASRILPIITTAHLPSAACDAYWPEVYWNQPIASEPRPNPYGDTPAPKTFINVSPLDPALFSTISECAAELVKGESSGKYSPLEVARWLDDLAVDVTQQLAPLASTQSAAVRRLVIDALIQADLGRFFAAKFRAGVLYAIHQQTGHQRALLDAVGSYGVAHGAWKAICERARGVYAADLSASDKVSNRGQWLDRLSAIELDVNQMRSRMGVDKAPSARPNGASAQLPPEMLPPAATQALSRRQRMPAPVTHTPPAGFRPAADLPLELTVARGRTVTAVRCHYRHVNQAERFETIEMTASGARHRATIPAAYCDSPYPLQYYFEVRTSAAEATLYPGLGASLMEQPYFVLRRL